MASDEATPTDFNTDYVRPRLSAIPLHSKPDSQVESLEEIENILSLIDLEFFQYQRTIHDADKAPRTITRKSRFVGNGLTFAVWKFSSGRSKLMRSFQGWKKQLQKANADPSSSDSFIIKRPLINRIANNAKVTDTMRLKAVLTEIKVLAHPPVSNHPNIVDLLGFLWDTQETGEKSIAPSLILEDALLGPLEAFQKPDFLTLSLDMKMEIVLDIAKGLDVLHDSGIVHGDLKSA
ncbi:hypothetical protein MMC29_005789 [Sticta canariensis]|nr:hypothetical protein [Sticta canariensis]